MDKTVAVALSGGVDSSVSAALLIRRNFQVLGIFMRHAWQPVVTPDVLPSDVSVPVVRRESDGRFTQSNWTADLFPMPADAWSAKQVADCLKIPFFIFDAGNAFREIVQYFADSFFQGTTPNPCALCNRRLKFGQLVDATGFLGADYFATGHYVRLEHQKEWLENSKKSELNHSTSGVVPDWLENQRADLPMILRGDPDKDQSYILFNIAAEKLNRLCFPLADRTKDETRQLAREWNLPVADRKDSQEVCFAENGKHIEFLEKYGSLPITEGNFVDSNGKILGRHRGYHRYTIGQRKGLGIGFGQRTFVQRIDAVNRNVVLGSLEQLATSTVRAERGNWHVDIPLGQELACDVKIRYRNRSTPARIIVDEQGNISARLSTPVYGVAPGQALVAYWGDRLLGGGWITGPNEADETE